MASSVDDFLDGYQAPVEEVPVCGRPGLISDHALLEAQVARLTVHGTLGGPPKELLDQLAAVEAEIEASVTVFRLQAIANRPWADLLAAHPPTTEERAMGYGVHPETFEPAALAACAIDPKVSVAQAERMADTLPRSEWAALTEAVRRLHEDRSTAPKSPLLSVLRPTNADSSATPLDEGSLAEPSSGDSGEQ